MCRCVFACGHMHVSVGAQRGPRHQSPAAKFVCVWFVCGGHMYLYMCIHVKTWGWCFSCTLFIEAGSQLNPELANMTSLVSSQLPMRELLSLLSEAESETDCHTCNLCVWGSRLWFPHACSWNIFLDHFLGWRIEVGCKSLIKPYICHFNDALNCFMETFNLFSHLQD